MKVSALLMAAFLYSGAAWAMGDSDHSSVAVDTKATGDKLEFTFKVTPIAGLHINMEGPWKLEIKSPDGLTFAKTSLPKADMNEKIPGFVATTTAKPTKASGKFDYTLVAFVCTNDQTQCFRDVHTGKAEWTAPAKP